MNLSFHIVSSVLLGILFFAVGCTETSNPEKTKLQGNTSVSTNVSASVTKDTENVYPKYWQDEPLTNLYRLNLYLGTNTVNAELALSVKERATGMMHRKSIGKDDGMLFVYPYAGGVAFYMKNTYIPLSLAYIDPEGTILEIYDLEPLCEDSVPSKSENVRYILEVRQGWFKENNVLPGNVITTEKGSLLELFPLQEDY